MAKLLKLKLENYRNLKSIEINFAGNDGKIVGANRIGKTNVLEAICYLLTDKLLGGSADVPSIKSHADPRAKVVVEGTFFTEEGEITLRKEFYEKWVRPRGSATEELAGHATDYYINGAKQSRAKDFFDALETKFGIPTDLFGLDPYQLVLDPFYLAKNICGTKDWKLARKAIIDIVGDVTPEEIYAKHPDARVAKADLEAHQYDDGEAKKAIRGEIDGFKKQMISNQGLLDEYGRMADVPQEELDSAKEQDEQILDQIAKLRAGTANPYAEEVSKLQDELFNLQREYQKIVSAPVDHRESEAIRKEVFAKSDALAELERERNTVAGDIRRYTDELSVKTAMQKTYKERLASIKEEVASIMVEDTCPTCGQTLPPEMVEEAVNRKKAQLTAEYQTLREKAVDNKKIIDQMESNLAILRSRDFDTEKTELQAEYFETKKKLDEALAKEQSFIKAPDPSIQRRIAEINDRLAEITKLQRQGSEGTLNQIQVLKAKRETLQETLAKHIAFEQAQRRTEEIKAANVEIGRKQADAEQRLWAVGEYVKAKLTILDEHMASKLGEVRFQLIKENIKAGSYDEVCVPFIINPLTGKATSTLFPDGSMSEQIFTGIQIIKSIRNVKDWSPLPVLFDQGGELDGQSAEKVAFEAEAQIIAVKVEGEGKTPSFVPFEY